MAITRKPVIKPAAIVRRRPAASVREVVSFADEEEEEIEEDPDLDLDEEIDEESEEEDPDLDLDPDAAEEGAEWELPTIVVPADDMPTIVGQVRRKDGKITKAGKKYFIQKGQTVTFLPVTNIGSMFSMAGLVRARGNGSRSLAAFEATVERLATVIAEWTLIYPNPKHSPRPQPYRNPKALLDLTADEVNWLLEKAQTIGQGQADTGKESSASAPSRSITKARATRR